MTDFLVRLAERAVAPATGLRPRPLSRFERPPDPGLGSSGGLWRAVPAGEEALPEEQHEREAPMAVPPRGDARAAVPPAVMPARPPLRPSLRRAPPQPADEPRESAPAGASAEPRQVRPAPRRAEVAPPGPPREPEQAPAKPPPRRTARAEAGAPPADVEPRARERPRDRPVARAPDERVVVRPEVVVRRERTEVREEAGPGAAHAVAPAPARTTAPASRRAAPPPVVETPPDVHVTIGRIEVRAVPEAKAAPSRSRAPVLTLEEYLRRRAGEAT